MGRLGGGEGGMGGGGGGCCEGAAMMDSNRSCVLQIPLFKRLGLEIV